MPPNRTRLSSSLAALLVLSLGFTGTSRAQSDWRVHDMSRPRPAVVTPAPQRLPVPPPPNAVVLFDGSDLSQWETPDGGAAPWTIRDGYLEVKPGTGTIQTKEGFGDVQLHIEWASPSPAALTSQDRGNSGVILMSMYEVQVLDSYENETYADGQAGALYGQHPPLFNASLPPGQWQSYDIIFRRPRFSRPGLLLEPARVTVIHNGIVVQDNAELWGATEWLQYEPYRPHPDELPLRLQDHGQPVRFRNIWLVELPVQSRSVPPEEASAEKGMNMPPSLLHRYVGVYARESGKPYRVVSTRDGLKAFVATSSITGQERLLDLIPLSPQRFALARTNAYLEFTLNSESYPTEVTFNVGGKEVGRGTKQAQ